MLFTTLTMFDLPYSVALSCRSAEIGRLFTTNANRKRKRKATKRSE